jgi:uridine phosphorylase
MTTKIRETDLILQNGALYHLGLKPENLSEKIITVGDPERVNEVSRHFDSIEFMHRHREFVTHTGFFKGKRISVISTGMGTDNIEILMTELDALVNIDLENRTIKAEKKVLEIVRVGTSGSLQPEIPVDSIVASELAAGFDTLMCFYPYELKPTDVALSEALKEMASIPFLPCIVRPDEELLHRVGAGMIRGNTLTCPGFYAPQGRKLRLSPRVNGLLDAYKNFRHEDFSISNFEMETAGYYAMGELLGHRMLSVSAIVASRANDEFSKNPAATIEKAILMVLERI